jgi:hypothetical protein
MALKRAGVSYSALRTATRLPPVERPAESPAEEVVAPAAADTGEQAGQGAPIALRPAAEPAARTKPVYYRLRVPYPAEGVCAEFDEITRAYDAETAIQTVFKRAFETWVENFGPETLARLDFDYPRGAGSFATSRIIKPEIVAAVIQEIDPMGIRTKTFIAERIALAAMKSYIAAEDLARGG